MGLCKAVLGRLAERGGTPTELQSISGHVSLTEVERTAATEQRRLSVAAIGKLKRRDKNV
jgi:hypothetical protein